MFKYSNIKAQNGVSLYLTVLIVTIILAISLGISSILVGQIKMISGMGKSVIAFYAADTGTERVLYEDKLCRPDCPTPLPCTPTPSPCPSPSPCPCPGCEGYPGSCQGLPDNSSFSGSLDNTSTYQATFSRDLDTIDVISIGIYQGIRRAIEATRE